MPLGIELAAAWVDVLTVTEIDAEISKNLDFLESETHGIPDRHRSVRAVFEYSWTMLSLEERQMFSALSVFRGGFTREAADSVAGASIRNLANLTNKSLLVFDRESGRSSVHELLPMGRFGAGRHGRRRSRPCGRRRDCDRRPSGLERFW